MCGEKMKDKPDTERQMLHDLTYLWNVKPSHRTKEQSGGCQSMGGKGKRRCQPKVQSLLCKGSEFWKSSVQHGAES